MTPTQDAEPETAVPSIWIDLDNTPHVPFFAPIIGELQRRGCAVFVTARDAYQVCALADLLHCDHERVGRHFGRHKAFKVMGAALRSLQLMPFAIRTRPVLAVSHGSRSQALTCALLRIPSLTMYDYEFTAPLTMGGPGWVLVPEVLASSRPAVSRNAVLTYPGLKEDVYASTFTPDVSIRNGLGLDEGKVIVTVRPPATEAHYHTADSDRLFAATMEFLRRRSEATLVLLPRNGAQRAELLKAWPPTPGGARVIVPDHAVSGLNLIWHSDLVISGGGTMNREAAALGVPAYSIFGGRLGAVDRFLADSGRLTLLERLEDIPTRIRLERRSARVAAIPRHSETLATIVNHVAVIAAGLAATARRQRPRYA